MKAQVCNAVHKTMTARSGRRFCGEAILRKCLCSDWDRAGPVVVGYGQKNITSRFDLAAFRIVHTWLHFQHPLRLKSLVV